MQSANCRLYVYFFFLFKPKNDKKKKIQYISQNVAMKTYGDLWYFVWENKRKSFILKHWKNNLPSTSGKKIRMPDIRAKTWESLGELSDINSEEIWDSLNLHFVRLRNKNVDYVNILFSKIIFLRCLYFWKVSLNEWNIPDENHNMKHVDI